MSRLAGTVLPVGKATIPSNLDAAREIEDRLLKEVARHGYSEASVFAIKLSLEEGLNNAVKHGNCFDRSKTIEVEYEIGPKKAMITIRDEGCGFRPGRVPDPTTDENLEKPSGRGIMLMKAYMDEVHFNQQGNEVRMIKWNA